MINVYGQNPKMPRKKSTTSSDSIPKPKGLFDHINHVREKQDPNYFDKLSEADKKSWSNFMVCRFLSMQPDIIDAVNQVQKYSSILSPKDFYKVLIAFVPKRRAFYPYIKSKSEKYNPALLTLLSSHFQDSERNVLEYISLLTKDDVKNIISKYGYNEKQTKELLEA
jgi:hypothetical protein